MGNYFQLNVKIVVSTINYKKIQNIEGKLEALEEVQDNYKI